MLKKAVLKTDASRFATASIDVNSTGVYNSSYCKLLPAILRKCDLSNRIDLTTGI